MVLYTKPASVIVLWSSCVCSLSMMPVSPGQERELEGRESETKFKLLGAVQGAISISGSLWGLPIGHTQSQMQLLGCHPRTSPIRNDPMSGAHLQGLFPEEEGRYETMASLPARQEYFLTEKATPAKGDCAVSHCRLFLTWHRELQRRQGG